MSSCTLCPRACPVDRKGGETGFCGASEPLKIARAALHAWEEPPISGERGSGAVFFSGCTLRCLYCQNRSISRSQVGKEVTVERFSDICLELQRQGAHNINLVTPTHYIPQIAQGLRLAREKGLTLPIVYNTSGYESPEGLKQMEGLVDVYLPDLKYYDDSLARSLSAAPDYFKTALAAIQMMLEQVGDPVFDADGLLQKGVIIRHLALPGHEEDSRAVIRAVAETFGPHVYLSLMNQYTPLGEFPTHPELNRRLSSAEYEKLVDFALSCGIRNGFIQEEETAQESFIPPFDLSGV